MLYENEEEEDEDAGETDQALGDGVIGVRQGGGREQSIWTPGSDNISIEPLPNRRVKTLPRALAKTHKVPFTMLGYPGRLALLVILLALLFVVVYYYAFSRGETPFEKFMKSEDFGVRFLFTAAGVVVGYLWESFFTCKLFLLLIAKAAESPRSSLQLLSKSLTS